jgi:hypothetical protein
VVPETQAILLGAKGHEWFAQRHITSAHVSSTSGDLLGATTILSFPGGVWVNGGIVPGAVGTTGAQLFSVTAGSTVYTFTVTSESQDLTSPSQINLKGSGTFSDGTAGDDAAGTWQLGFGATGAAFSFQSTAGTNVPDGGMTVMLLGAALSGLALIRRKLA